MEELGIIINQYGEFLTFGKWVPREIRNKDNINNWHDDSFLTIYDTEWFRELDIPYDKSKRYTSQLELFARCGIIIINNLKNEENGNNSAALQIVLPESITEEQNNTMEFFKDKLTVWAGDNFCFIDIINESNGDIIGGFTNINDYYKYLEEQKNKLHK